MVTEEAMHGECKEEADQEIMESNAIFDTR